MMKVIMQDGIVLQAAAIWEAERSIFILEERYIPMPMVRMPCLEQR